LHVTVLDTVVHHLDIVSSAVITDPITAGLTIGFGSNGLEDVFDVGPGLFVATRHERRAISSTFLTTGDTSADEANPLLFEVLGTAVRVRVVGVTTIDDDVPGIAVWEQLLDEVVDCRAGHDKQHHTTRFLQFGTKLLDGVGPDDRLA
jgi:hypothetical protein